MNSIQQLFLKVGGGANVCGKVLGECFGNGGGGKDLNYDDKNKALCNKSCR